jgi:hypothetical protein
MAATRSKLGDVGGNVGRTGHRPNRGQVADGASVAIPGPRGFVPASRRRDVPSRMAITCRIAAKRRHTSVAIVTTIAPCPRRDAGALSGWRWGYHLPDRGQAAPVVPCPRRDAGDVRTCLRRMSVPSRRFQSVAGGSSEPRNTNWSRDGLGGGWAADRGGDTMKSVDCQGGTPQGVAASKPCENE